MSSPPFSDKGIAVYDLANAGFFEYTVFCPVGITSTAVTWSTIDEILKKTDSINSINAQLEQEFPMAIGSLESTVLMNLGNDTEFKRTMILRPKASFLLVQCFLNLAFGINMSARTSGSKTLVSINVIVRVRKGYSTTGHVLHEVKYSYATGLAACDAAAEFRVFILQDSLENFPPIPFGSQLEIEFVTVTTGDGTNTTQVGLMPLFSPILTDVSKPVYVSGCLDYGFQRLDSKEVVLAER